MIESARKLILPGVGHFSKGMEKLHSSNLIDLLNERIMIKKVPILGICLDMQLFARSSEEGNAAGLSWIDSHVSKFCFRRDEKKFKIPHMGWNNIQISKNNGIFKGISDNDSFYFVHSYHVICDNRDIILSTSNYGIPFVSSLQKNNIIGVQFHPEKSHSAGLRVLKNFIEL